MTRVRLIHWKEPEALPRARQLEAEGLRVDGFGPADPATLKALRTDPPDAVLIDLTRLPSGGRQVGVALRQQKSTRQVPLVFVGGLPAKVERVRQKLPDATFTEWDEVAEAVRQAIASPPAELVVPSDRMPGYSETPLAKKLGVGEGTVVALVGAPDDFAETLGELPAGAALERRGDGPRDLTLWFARDRAELEARLPEVAAPLGESALWIIWPKKSSALASDIGQNEVREAGLAHGLVDYKVCRVDDTWAGLKFAWRKGDRRGSG